MNHWFVACDELVSDFTKRSNKIVVALSGGLLVHLRDVIHRAVILSQDLSLQTLLVEVVQEASFLGITCLVESFRLVLVVEAGLLLFPFLQGA